MDNINLSLLSRPQLVHLLLQIVDLLAQPLPQPNQPLHPGQVMHAPPRLEPYDASIDPWNETRADSTGHRNQPGGKVSGAHAWFNLPRRCYESRSHCLLPNGSWGKLVL